MKSALLILTTWICALVVSANVVHKAHRDGLKTAVRMARQAEEEQGPATVSAIATGPPPTMGNGPCTPDQCNNKGTCFGTKAMPFCFCQLGFAGPTCNDRYCDSARDCNGRGWCMGTSSSYTCLCNIGFSGTRCELQTVSSSSAVSTPSPFGATTATPRLTEEGERLSEPVEEQI